MLKQISTFLIILTSLLSGINIVLVADTNSNQNQNPTSGSSSSASSTSSQLSPNDPNNLTNNQDGYSPQYVIKNNTIEFTATGLEKNQKVVLGYKYKQEPEKFLVTPTNAVSGTCTINAGNNTKSFDNKLTTKFKDNCRIKYTFTFPEDGKELAKDSNSNPTINPASQYQFSFYSVDLAGNLSTYSTNPTVNQTYLPNNANPTFNYTQNNNAQTLASNLASTPTDTKIQGAINSTRSRTLTVYHDTKSPQYTGYLDIQSDSYGANGTKGTIPDLALNQTTTITGGINSAPTFGTTPITKDTTIRTTAYTENRADLQYQYTNLTTGRENSGSFNTYNPAIANQLLTPGSNPTQAQIDAYINANYNNGLGGTNVTTSQIQLAGFDENQNKLCSNSVETTLNQTYTANNCPILTNNYTGKWYDNLSRTTQTLGNAATDESRGTNCITTSNSPIVNRRIGTCSDGLYSIRTRSTDTAGNSSPWVEKVVERDGVKPGDPVVNLTKTGDKLPGEQISLNEFSNLTIQGEQNTTATIDIFKNNNKVNTRPFTLNGSSYNTSNATYTINDLLGKLECGGNQYFVKVTLTDRAGNSTTTVQSQTINTDACGTCGGGQLQSPLKTGATIAYVYGYSDKYYQDTGSKFHSGVDYTGTGATYGTPIYSAATGTVSFVGLDNGQYKGLGNYVKVSHGNGLETSYGHMNGVPPVTVGQQVTTNTIIGYIGNTGFIRPLPTPQNPFSGTHLHFQVMVNGKHENPKPYLDGKGSSNDPENLSPRQRTILGCVDLRGGTESDEDSSTNDNVNSPDFNGSFEDGVFYKEDYDCTDYLTNSNIPTVKAEADSCFGQGQDTNVVQELSMSQIRQALIDEANTDNNSVTKEIKLKVWEATSNEVLACLIDSPAIAAANDWWNTTKQVTDSGAEYLPLIGDAYQTWKAGAGAGLGGQLGCADRWLTGVFGAIGLTITGVTCAAGSFGAFIGCAIGGTGGSITVDSVKAFFKNTLKNGGKELLKIAKKGLAKAVKFVVQTAFTAYLIGTTVNSFASRDGNNLTEVSEGDLTENSLSDGNIFREGEFNSSNIVSAMSIVTTGSTVKAIVKGKVKNLTKNLAETGIKVWKSRGYRNKMIVLYNTINSVTNAKQIFNGVDVDHSLPPGILKEYTKAVKALLARKGLSDINDPRILRFMDSSVNHGRHVQLWKQKLDAWRYNGIGSPFAPRNPPNMTADELEKIWKEVEADDIIKGGVQWSTPNTVIPV